MAQFRDKLPSHYSILLTGPPGVGKFEYLLDLLGDFLAAGERVVFVCVDLQPQEVRERASGRGIRLEPYEGRSLLFVYCYTPSISENPGPMPSNGTIQVSSFSSLAAASSRRLGRMPAYVLAVSATAE
jgi:KaiC/GvpD/RAD55 family RecA-like ATPase